MTNDLEIPDFTENLEYDTRFGLEEQDSEVAECSPETGSQNT